jgi:hypothetical protein
MRCAAPSGASRLPSGSTSATGTGTASWTPGWAPSTWRSRSCVRGSYFPEWPLERRKRAESALISVVVTCYLLGVSTRRMDKLVATLGITSLSKSQVSRMVAELDEQETGWWDEHGDLALREMANCDRKHVGVTDRVLPAVGVSGLWGKCPPKSPEQRPICVT